MAHYLIETDAPYDRQAVDLTELAREANLRHRTQGHVLNVGGLQRDTAAAAAYMARQLGEHTRVVKVTAGGKVRTTVWTSAAWL